MDIQLQLWLQLRLSSSSSSWLSSSSSRLSSYPDPAIWLSSWLSGYPYSNLGNIRAPICNIVSSIENIQSSMGPPNFGSASQ